VINATPNILHLPCALACIERGIPVLVENLSPTRRNAPGNWSTPLLAIRFRCWWGTTGGTTR
jgi:hypothetical protein